MSHRHGSVLLIALIVIFLLVAGVFVIQRLSLENARMSRSLHLVEDSMHRADGLIEMLISRYKRELRYSSVDPLAVSASGAEGGIWDDRRYELGWEREEPTASALRWRMWVWIQFPDDRPRPTFRYELTLRFAAPLAPQVLIVGGVAQDAVEPAVAASRQGAKGQLTRGAGDRLRAAARAEAWTDRLEAAPTETPAAFAQRAGGGPAPGEVGALADALAALAALDDKTVAADRLAAARAVVARCRNLPRRWQDGAAYELAGALINDAEFASGAVAKAERLEALALLEVALGRSAGGCGDAKLAWRWASLKLRLRANASDPAELAAVRQAAVRTLLTRAGTGFFHRRADVEVRELAPYLEQLWQARVAASVQVSPTQYLVMSVREDGSVPIVHSESAAPIEPLAFTHDGGAIVAMGHTRFDPGNWRGGGATTTHWRLPLEGLEPIDMEPSNGYYPDPKDQRMRFYSSAYLSPDDRVTIANYSNIDETSADEMLYPLGIPNGWFVQERTSIQFGNRLDSGPYAESFVLSPRGDEVLGIFHNARRQLGAGLRKMSTDRVVAAGYVGTSRADVADSPRGEERPPVFITLPDAIAPGGAGAGLSWETQADGDWVALTTVEPAGSRVHFWKTSGSAPVEQLSASLPFDPAVGKSYPYYARMGKLVRNPPGYLLGLKDSVYLVPLPGSGPAEPPKAWPIGMAGQLDGIGDVCAPPWGDVAFMAAKVGGQPYSLLALDLHTGQAKTLLGPGSKVKSAREVWRVAVSPVPVTRGAPLAPIPE